MNTTRKFTSLREFENAGKYILPAYFVIQVHVLQKSHEL